MKSGWADGRTGSNYPTRGKTRQGRGADGGSEAAWVSRGVDPLEPPRQRGSQFARLGGGSSFGLPQLCIQVLTSSHGTPMRVRSNSARRRASSSRASADQGPSPRARTAAISGGKTSSLHAMSASSSATLMPRAEARASSRTAVSSSTSILRTLTFIRAIQDRFTRLSRKAAHRVAIRPRSASAIRRRAAQCTN